MSTWLVTGASGFIGSQLVGTLVGRGERVVALDIKPFRGPKGPMTIQGDIRNLDQCRKACEGVDFVLHQAAQCSVPLSIENPIETHETNVTGFLNILLAAREAGVKRLVYASSCAVPLY
jgi:UDP-N-acetylglucosamine/UDP-N-acetylgalactosamine 4-epimerase